MDTAHLSAPDRGGNRRGLGSGAAAPGCRTVCSLGTETHRVEPCRPLLPGRTTTSSRLPPQPQQGHAGWGHPVARPLSWAAGSTEPPGGQEVRGDGEGMQMSWRPRSTPHMLVLIRDWLLAGVSSPWLPSLGGDLTWIWLRSTAARSIMALARRWNSLPISRDFSKVVLR